MGIRKVQNVNLDTPVGSGLTLEGFAELLHTEKDAFVTVSNLDKEGRWIERNYQMDDWFNHVLVDKETSSYQSVNTFYKPTRGNLHVRHVNALYVDLDGREKGISKQDIINGIDFFVRTERLLEPTFIVDSGRGIYGIWKVESAPGKYKSVQKLYNRIETFLVELMEELGADNHAKDLARVLRTPGTYNPKSKTKVEVLRYTGKVYTLRLMQELMNDVNGVDWSLETQKFADKTKSKPKTGNLSRLFNFYTLAIARARDLEKITELRKGELTGFRNTLLHVYSYQMMLIHKDLNVSRHQTKILNDQLVTPLTDSEIKHVCKSVYKAYQEHLKDRERGYNYKNSTIIERLQITVEEQKHMKTLIESEEKQKRNTRNKRTYRRDKNGLTPKQKEVKDRRDKVLELRKQGLKQLEIARELGVSVDTIKKDYKVFREEQ